MLDAMENESQYGHPLYLEGFQAESSAKKLARIHLSKGSESALYDEAWLQRLIMNQPSLLPIDQIESAFTNLTPICIELPTQSGYLDNLLVTPSGDVALIECKLWRNPEARREVAGQIIEYAKDMSTWSYEELEKRINRTKSLDTSNEKTRRLYEMVAATRETDEAAFHDAVSRNLKLDGFFC